MKKLLQSWKVQRVFMLPWLLRRRIRNGDDLKRFHGIRSAKVVTFDVFDTALLRSVAQPTDVLAVAAWRAERRFGYGIGMRALLDARRNAEVAARRDARAEGRDEVTLGEIYARFPALPPETLPGLRDEELATERDVCYANPAILAIYRDMIAAGTSVAFISDTSLPETFLESMLSEKGYTGPHRVFASSAFGTSKARGKLFPLVASRLGVRPSEIWHIGDNSRSDVLQARRAGVNGLWYRPKLRAPTHRERGKSAGDERGIARSLMAGIPQLLSGESSAGESTWQAIGFTVAGPLYLGFTQWLMGRLAEFVPGRVYFCSRDGRIVQQVYQLLRKFYPAAPPASYLMVSRRSLRFPTMERLDDPALDMLCGNHNRLWMPVETYLTRVGLDPRECRTAMLERGLSPGILIHGAEQRRKLRGLFQALENEVLKVARRERVVLVRYLEQETCLDTRRLALCDIGWAGSLQMGLALVLKSERRTAEISGYYLGTGGEVRQLAGTRGTAAGWLIDGGAPEDRCRTLYNGTSVVELMFTANHGTVRGYRDEQGRATPILEDLGIEATYVAAAEAIQGAGLEFVDRYLKAFGDLPAIELGRDDVFPGLARLIDHPTFLEAKNIGELTPLNGFGNALLGEPMAKPPSLWQSVVDPSGTLAKFRQAPWRSGFLVRFFRIRSVASAAMTILRRRQRSRSSHAKPNNLS
jgi:predicted HAD superfamily hydrolase